MLLKRVLGLCMLGASAVLLGVVQRANRKVFPPPEAGGAIVITGAGSGIGKHAANTLAGEGFAVFAGVRDPKDMHAEYAPGVTPLLLDVTDSASIEQAVEAVARETEKRGIPLVGIVNNAGLARIGALEFEPPEVVRKVFDVNVFGLLEVTQRFLPLLRRYRGRIVNVSSIAGQAAVILNGVYAASKYAVEALSDSLRNELEPLGVSVSVINAGLINTSIIGKAREQLNGAENPKSEELYGPTPIFRKNLEKLWGMASPPSESSAAILDALTSLTPSTRYYPGNVGGLHPWVALLFKFVLPDRLYDKFTGLQSTTDM